MPYRFLVSLALATTILSSCANQSTPSGPVHQPLEGLWIGEQISFELTGQQLNSWFVTDIQCKGTPPTEEGASPCVKVLQSVPERNAALQEGSFVIPVGDLTIEGVFDKKGHVSGEWIYHPTDCCVSKGKWEAWHKSWYDTQGPVDDGQGSTSAEDSGTGDTGGGSGDTGNNGTSSDDGGAGDEGSDDGGRVVNGYNVPKNASDDQLAAMSRVNWYRKNVGVALMDMDQSLNQCSQSHADYYTHYAKEYEAGKIPGGAHQESSKFPDGFTGESFGARCKAAGYKGQPGFEVMGFLSDPVKAVDGWVATVYHRIPIVSPDAIEGGYGGSLYNAEYVARCDVMDFGYKAHKDKSLVIVYPFVNQTGVPVSWNGAENPQPPKPNTGYPSGPVITAHTSANVPLKISGHKLTGPNGSEIDHVWHPKGDNQFMSATWAMYSHNPLPPSSKFTVTLTGTLAGKNWSRIWSFTTGK